MENATASYSEATERTKIDEVALSHLSIEVGHFYMNDLLDPDGIRAQFTRIAPLVGAFRDATRAKHGKHARISTCFLIDDYFRNDTSPKEVLDSVLGIAAECGVPIDYLAREAGCWQVPGGAARQGEPFDLAAMVSRWIVAEPPKNSTGRRPPTSESGWLCNGRRSSEDELTQAMREDDYRPPEEFGRREHSIFLDVQMWSERMETGPDGVRQLAITWSCPFLAAIWHLLRLGLIRDEGRTVVKPQLWPSDTQWPDAWWDMPALIQLNPRAKPFAAYESMSILPQRYLGIEHAVRVILDHVDLDQDVVGQLVARGAADNVTVPRTATERLSHLMLNNV